MTQHFIENTKQWGFIKNNLFMGNKKVQILACYKRVIQGYHVNFYAGQIEDNKGQLQPVILLVTLKDDSVLSCKVVALDGRSIVVSLKDLVK